MFRQTNTCHGEILDDQISINRELDFARSHVPYTMFQPWEKQCHQEIHSYIRMYLCVDVIYSIHIYIYQYKDIHSNLYIYILWVAFLLSNYIYIYYYTLIIMEIGELYIPTWWRLWTSQTEVKQIYVNKISLTVPYIGQNWSGRYLYFYFNHADRIISNQ